MFAVLSVDCRTVHTFFFNCSDQKYGVEACISVNQAERVLEIGQSKDYGTCQSRKKDGTPCMVPVNKATCPTCVHHLRQEYGKAANKRASTSGTRHVVDPKGRFSDKVSFESHIKR
jgi:hypothetical protein